MMPAVRADAGGAVAVEPLPALAGSGWAIAKAMVRDRTAVLGLVLIVSLVAAAALADVLAPHDPDAVDVARKFAPLSGAHPLGTDNLGRDVASRLLFGARLSIGSALVAGLSTALIGLVVGMLAAFYGGLLDTILSRVIDVVLAFPLFLLALAITGILGPGLGNLMISVVAVAWAGYARIVRSAVLAERDKPYMEAARAAGSSSAFLLGRHLLPDIVAPIVVLTSLDIGVMLLAISGLSFLGLGVKPPTAEWGAMLSEGRNYLDQAPFLMLYPGLAIFLLVLGFNLLGDGLRDALDPRTRRR